MPLKYAWLVKRILTCSRAIFSAVVTWEQWRAFGETSGDLYRDVASWTRRGVGVDRERTHPDGRTAQTDGERSAEVAFLRKPSQDIPDRRLIPILLNAGQLHHCIVSHLWLLSKQSPNNSSYQAMVFLPTELFWIHAQRVTINVVNHKVWIYSMLNQEARLTWHF